MKTLRLLALVVLFLAIAVPVSAKDEWIQVRSKNFFLVGNASEKDIRKVATRLEQFRETFRLLFSKMNLTSPIATNVVVFKSDSAYKPFKPKRADGKTDNFIAGFFQPGEDVNYITLSTEGEDADTFGTIFHEYVHFIVNTNFGKSEVPPWFNEGLAEYYQTFAIEDDQKVKLGLPQSIHLQLLNQSKLIPLEQLFKVSNYQLLQTGDHSRSIFYAESWALIHYFVQTGKADGLSKFLTFVLNDTPPEKAFQDAFQMTYAQMEKELRKYVSQSTYHYHEVTFKNKLVFDTDMRVAPLSEADSNAYLGDLLYHNNRADDAEPYLLRTLAVDANSSMANTTLGMVKMRQHKYDEAKTYLEKAVTGDQKNYRALYNYAYLLSRDARDEFGYVRSFPADSVAKMRELLKKAIAINPAFTESYELLAFVDLVNNDQLDDAVAQLKTAMRYQPGNQRYAIRIAEIYSRQDKLAEAGAIATKISQTTDDQEIKSRADSLLKELAQRKEIDERNAAAQKQYEDAMKAANQNGRPVLRMGAKQPSPEEMEKLAKEENLRSINRALRKPLDGENRVIGHIQSINCKVRPIAYSIKTDDGTFTVTSKDFQSLTLMAFAENADQASLGCDAKLADLNAVLTYKASSAAKGTNRGELVAVEYVPPDFRLMDEKEMAETTNYIEGNFSQTSENPPAVITVGTGAAPNGQDVETQRRDAMMNYIRTSIRQPGQGEKRELGFIDKAECTNKGVIYFYLHTQTQTLKLFNASPRSIQMRTFAPDMEDVRIGCPMKAVEAPVVFVYKDTPDPKAKANGEILSLEFVPKTFVLN
ncbi:MAG TPA: tetratricopeptide repeat protein [Pyrinomonadaceae bacterium]|nr:tetratricopeptide repeat protein [Pyrinomonadaceae bacterium]